MKGQEGGPGLGVIYITFFILLVGVGGYWILHSNTWVDYNLLYGPPKSITGKVFRIESPCDNPKKTVFMLDTGSSQAFVYIGSRLDIAVGDSVSANAYNVSGRGLIFDLVKTDCEPAGQHYFAIKLYNTKTGMTFEGSPWQR